LRSGRDAAVGLALAAGLILLAFLTAGGVALGPNTWAEIVLVLIGAVLALAVVLYGAPRRAWGAVTLLLFAAVAALTAISIAWSVVPDTSWTEAGRALGYLGAFGGAAALARLAGERWRGVIGAIAVVATVLSAYALLVKVFPGTFDPGDPVGRVRAPFSYWNATGLMAALGLPACLWAGARRDRGPIRCAASVPAAALLITVVMLSYSRSALLAAIVALALWFTLVPLRLRGAAVLVLGLAGGLVLTIWALATQALTHDRATLAARTSAGHSFGWLLLIVLGLMALAGLGAALAIDRRTLSPARRRRIGIILIGLVALVPVAGVGALAASSRGLTGQISHAWNSLTNPNSGVSDNPGRLVELGSSRPRYWSEGLKVGEHAVLHGVGAGGYGTARIRYTTDPWIVGHAHSYPVETFADFGLIGLALNLALLATWGLATRRTLAEAFPARDPEARVDPAAPEAIMHERAGLLTLLCVVVAFGVSSAIDWTWFIPGTAVPALVCAGWLVGRGPLAERPGRVEHRRRVSSQPLLGATIAGIIAVTLIAAWAVWQPLRSADADAAAITALTQGNTRQAFADAETAVARDPLSAAALWELSAIYSAAGDQSSARAELVKAVNLQPQNPATWRELGLYDIQQHQPQRALSVLQQASRLGPAALPTLQAIQQAQRDLAHR
jgi:hypothetical protein